LHTKHGERVEPEDLRADETWRNRAIEGNRPHVFLDGLSLKRSWGGEVRNVSLLVAIGVNA
jgi:putative transposase